MRSSANNMSAFREKSIRLQTTGCCLTLCYLIALSSILMASISAQSITTKVTEKSKRDVHNNNKGSNFAPKLTHQLQNQLESAGKTFSVECPVEAQPDPQIEWFKDGQRLEASPERVGLMELHGKELMFIQLVASDEGDYHCRATNYLGAVDSRPFQLQLQRRPEPKIRVEPRQVEAAPMQPAEFTCLLPNSDEPVESGQVSWRRNGRPLQRHLNLNKGRFWSSRRSSNEFVLTIKPVLVDDHNSTYTCQLMSSVEDIGRESASASRLLVMQPVNLDNMNLGPPITNLGDETVNNISKSEEPRRHQPSLRETLKDLYELIKPSILVLSLLLIVSLLSLAQLIYIRRRSRQNRYMKHQLFSSASGSGGSRGSSASGHHSSDLNNPLADPNHQCDPVLNSLMARTFSAPSCSALGGASKKFRSYRDHMRKVAACSGPNTTTPGDDLVDAYFSPQQQQHFSTNLPNLYNQSLAAREQARALLQASSHSTALGNDHMRSLSNLSQQKSYLLTGAANNGQQQQNLNSSHLNLPASFVQFAANSSSQSSQSQDQRFLEGLLVGGFNLAPQNNFQAPSSRLQASERQKLQDEHYQLVNCSSISPSSTSSMVGSNGSSNCQASGQQTSNGDKLLLLNGGKQQKISNHYSTIENNESVYEEEDDENRYEQLHEDPSLRFNQRLASTKPADQNQRTSTFVADCPRSSISNNSSSSGCTGDSSANSLANRSLGLTRARLTTTRARPSAKNTSQQQDQLSPYAVSSICANLPPVNPNEAMRALNEQFDVGQLMLANGDDNLPPQLPFDNPPPTPPPPPPSQTQQQDNQNQSKSRRYNHKGAPNQQ